MRHLFIATLFFIPAILSAKDFYASEYGAAGDGLTDDGPAIQAAINDLLQTPGSNQLIFDASRQFYIKEIESVYLFNLINEAEITIAGNGSVFLLDGAKRFLHAEKSENIVLRNVSIDYKPLPFVEGTIIKVNSAENYIDVKIDDYFTMPPLGGPTNDPAEQAYFGMIWRNGPNSLLSQHYYVSTMKEAYTGSIADRMVRVVAKNFSGWDKIPVNSGKISLPVRGIAHIGADQVIHILECNDVKFENVNIWSAPWFAIGVTRNSGYVEFQNVNIMPPAGSPRILSSWRDGFHVKSNYASLLFNNCHLEGMGDDAFNIASFMSTVKTVYSGTKIQVQQNYPLSIVPYKVGDMVVIYDITKGIILGRTKILSGSGFYQPANPPAPLITITLEEEIAGMNSQCVIWNESSANPNTLLKNCTIYMSCRFQSSVTIDSCNITALSWFYGANIEGPLPGNIVVKNSKLYLGRGNELSTLVFSTSITYNGEYYEPKSRPITNVLLLNNNIKGNLVLKHCQNVSIVDNNFSISNSQIQVSNCRNLLFRNNTKDYTEIRYHSQVDFQDTDSQSDSEFEISFGDTMVNLLKPFPHWYGFEENGKRLRFHALPDQFKPLYLRNRQILGRSYNCYQLNMPAANEPIKKICLEERTYLNTSKLRFWTYVPEGNAALVVFAVLPGGEGQELYRSALSPDSFINHEIETTGTYPGVLQIIFTPREGETEERQVFLGDPGLILSETGLSIQFYDEFFERGGNQPDEIRIIKNPGQHDYTFIFPEANGMFDVFDMQGRLLVREEVDNFQSYFNAGSLCNQIVIIQFIGTKKVPAKKLIL